jgi:hypothetical protein
MTLTTIVVITMAVAGQFYMATHFVQAMSVAKTDLDQAFKALLAVLFFVQMLLLVWYLLTA